MKKTFLSLCLVGLMSGNAIAALDLNAATEAEMVAAGISKKTAAKIVEARKTQKNGAFFSIEQLKEIHGIGDKTMSQLRSKFDPIPQTGAIQPQPSSKK